MYLRYYGTGNMTTEALASFNIWYEQHKNGMFDFQKEILHYCQMDVEILAEASLKFRSMIMDGLGFDPYTNSTTIASACMFAYRYKFLQPDSIGIVPHGGYRYNEIQSIKAIKWLKCVSVLENLNIQHARNGLEVIPSKHMTSINDINKSYL